MFIQSFLSKTWKQNILLKSFTSKIIALNMIMLMAEEAQDMILKRTNYILTIKGGEK